MATTVRSGQVRDGTLVNADINASAAIDWTKISKTGSSLADLITRSAADLSSGTLGVARGGTGAGVFTAGSVVFAGASGVYTENNANLFWDNGNARLGIGNAAPGHALDVSGTVIQVKATVAPEMRINLDTGTGSVARFAFYEGATLRSYMQYNGSTFATTNLQQAFQFVASRVNLNTAKVQIDGDVNAATSRALSIGQNGRTFEGFELIANSRTWVFDNRGSVDSPNNRLLISTAGTGSIGNVLSASFDGGVIGIGTSAYPTTGTNGLVFADGTALATMGSNTAGLYANDVGGTVNMFAINEAGVVTQLTGLTTAYTPTNVTTDRAYDANATTLDEIADVLGTLIADLQARGICG